MYELPSSEQPNINREHDDRVFSGIMRSMIWKDFMGDGLDYWTEHAVRTANIAYARNLPIGEAFALHMEEVGQDVNYDDPTDQSVMDTALDILGFYYNLDALEP